MRRTFSPQIFVYPDFPFNEAAVYTEAVSVSVFSCMISVISVGASHCIHVVIIVLRVLCAYKAAIHHKWGFFFYQPFINKLSNCCDYSAAYILQITLQEADTTLRIIFI